MKKKRNQSDQEELVWMEFETKPGSTGSVTEEDIPKKKSILRPILMCFCFLVAFGCLVAAGYFYLINDEGEDEVLEAEAVEEEGPSEPRETKKEQPEKDDSDLIPEGEIEAQGYVLADAIRTDLTYSVSFETYEYENAPENVEITIVYPVVESEYTPNLDILNENLQYEIEYLVEGYETGFIDFLKEDGYFHCYAAAYVTYMDEREMSVVFSEYIDSNFYQYYHLYSLNFDMKAGVMLDNQDLIKINDRFVKDLREKSQEQNGIINALTILEDSDIEFFMSGDNLIYFDTPEGREIGFNYDSGWLTVTYPRK